MSKPILYIFAGANGCGKTTIAKSFTNEFNIPFLNADEIANSLDGIFEDVLIKASKIFLNEIQAKLTLKKSFAIESTLSGKTIGNIIKTAKQKGYIVSIVYLFLHNPTSNINRIKIRVSKGGHHVKDEDVIRRFYRSKTQFWTYYRNLCDNWVLLYNSSERLIVVANGNNNSIEVQDEELYESYIRQANGKK